MKRVGPALPPRVLVAVSIAEGDWLFWRHSGILLSGWQVFLTSEAGRVHF